MTATATNATEQKTYRLRQTLPNGATRDIEISLLPDMNATPTAAESAAGARIFKRRFSSDVQHDAVRNRLQYFVPYGEMSPELCTLLGTPAEPGPAGGAGSGAYVHVDETLKEGAGLGSASLKDYVDGELSDLFALASAIGNIARDGVAAAAKQETARDNVVRTLDIMTATSAALEAKLVVLATLLKSRFGRGRQMQPDGDDEVTMRDARVAVVPCKPAFNAVFDFEFSRSQEDGSSFVGRWQESLTAKVTVRRR